MCQKAIAIVVLVMAAMTVQAGVGIGSQVITTGTEIKVLEPGPDLQAIIDGITDEGPDKPYLIKLGPGEYTLTLTLVMAPHISIMGSGQGVTILTGAISSASTARSTIVKCASDTTLSDLSVENTGGGSAGSASTAIYCEGVFGGLEPRVERVTATASGGTNNFGVHITYSWLTMTQVTATAAGGTRSYGVRVSHCSPTMTQVTATASNGTNNYGVDSFFSSPAMTQVIATASGGNASFGVFNHYSSPKMTEGTATAADGNDNYGVYNSNSGSEPQIRSSLLYGSTNAMRFGGSTGTRISDSQLVGGIDADPAGVQCRNTYDENLADVTC